MLSATSFTDELARYQTADPRYRKIIDRWREFAGANDMWRKLQDAASRQSAKMAAKNTGKLEELVRGAFKTGKPTGEIERRIHAQAAASRLGPQPLHARDFIDFVLSATWSVERIIEQDKHVRSEFQKLKQELKLAVNDADSPSELSELLSTFDERILKLHRSSYDFNSRPVSRENTDNSRDRKAFLQRVGYYFKRRFGMWFEEVVADLHQIVFDRECSRDEVRWALKPSTRAGRKSGPRKALP
jgi:hypothetical protein